VIVRSHPTAISSNETLMAVRRSAPRSGPVRRRPPPNIVSNPKKLPRMSAKSPNTEASKPVNGCSPTAAWPKRS
jgi:hypothetical protein